MAVVRDQWLAWMIDVRISGGTTIARGLSRIGGQTVTLPLRLLVVAALSWQRRWLQLGAFVGATVSSELCIGPLKAVIDRQRPAARVVGTSGSSFPSGHAIVGAVTAFGVVVVFKHASPRRLIAIGAAAAFAGLMAASRTYLGVHWSATCSSVSASASGWQWCARPVSSLPATGSGCGAQQGAGLRP